MGANVRITRVVCMLELSALLSEALLSLLSSGVLDDGVEKAG